MNKLEPAGSLTGSAAQTRSALTSGTEHDGTALPAPTARTLELPPCRPNASPAAAAVSVTPPTAPASAAPTPALWLAAWALVLWRLSGQDAFVVHGRRAGEGIALSVSLEDDPTVDQWLQRCHDVLARAATAVPEATPAPAESVTAVLGWDEAPGDAPAQAGSIELRLGPAGASAVLAFDPSRFDSATVARWADAVSQALGGLCAGGATRVGDLLLAGPAERALLDRFNATAESLGGDDLVHELVEFQARRQPTATAVQMGATCLGYGELDARADALAARLRHLGVGPDVPVALYVERSLEMIVGLLAVLKAGGAYVPLDPHHPPDRTLLILQGARPAAVLTQAALQAQLPASEAPVIVLDDADASAGPTEPAASVVRPTPDHLAYVIFTSGSTGQPKGVAMPHRGLVNLLRWQATHPQVPAPQRTLQFAALGFDVAFQEIFATLSTGGTLVLLDEATRRDPQALLQLMREQTVERLFLPFIALQNIAEYALASGDPLPPLQDVMTAGEQLHASPAIRALFARLPGCRLHNQYGPTESHVVTALTLAADPATWEPLPTIGTPIANNRIHVLDPKGRELPVGAVGEIYIGGVGVARGYLHRPELTQERFVADRFAPGEGARLYKTGDIGRWRADGEIEYLGRNDHQVKVRGFRVELGDIESALLQHPSVREAAVLAPRDGGGEARLVAYVSGHGAGPSRDVLRQHLQALLPPYMVPGQFVVLDAMPLSPNGKIERRALPTPPAERPDIAQPFEEPRDEAEHQVCAAFARALRIDRVGRIDNFFDLGGDSLRVLKVIADLQAAAGRRLSTNLFFRDPTPAAIARELSGEQAVQAAPRAARSAAHGSQEPIAIVGMAGRFPGAADVDAFWANLCAGRDGIRFFDDAQLDAGVSAALRNDAAYVRARGVIDGVEDFDAAFFGINPKEATLMDPQQRIFLEICWECLERAGYAPDQQSDPVGVYAGMYNGTYFQRHLMPRPELIESVGEFTVMLGNEKDYLATRVANRLNLTGPAISLNTACSTSLVALAQGFHALRSGQCDMALAGGVAITCPPNSGYVHQEGAMLSPDGRTRSFDAQAGGTVFSDGAAVVLLKRLSDAQADGDVIYATVRGVGVNNDGAVKASFTAPSVDGQVAVISAALASAGVEARSISYVEAHGTATPMGDPVEVEALARSYALQTADTGFCALGSVKSNVGHLLMAAGATGVIKTALALHTEQLPATLHFESPNPAIDFAATPFRVQSELGAWPRTADAPRRAGVSSFGVGGTNAHVILEEAPSAQPSEAVAGPQLLVLSARSPAALNQAAARLADHLRSHPDENLGDVAHTLYVGRKAFPHRLAVVAESAVQAAEALGDPASPRRVAGAVAPRAHAPVFLFPGQGAQYAGMGRTLYVHDEAVQAALDECFAAFAPLLPYDLREAMFSDDDAALLPTSVTQPATFALEYALARRALVAGIAPQALVGHSIGEFAAAVVAGVMSLPDAALLVARRGEWMQALPAGRMLSVRCAAERLAPYLDNSLALAADNAPNACVAAGPAEDIEALQARLEADGIASRALQTSHAFHSQMMEPAVAPFEALVCGIALSAPRIAIYSTSTGARLSDAQATDPAYWARHLRETVRFSPALRAALADLPQPLLLELGPRNTLSTLARQHALRGQPAPVALPCLGASPEDELVALRLAFGRAWALGLAPDLGVFDARERKCRVCLPTTPFERKRHWVDIASTTPLPLAAPTPSVEIPLEPSMPTVPARRATLQAKLREVFEDISGTPMADADGATPFIDLGLDSLVLTQAALQVKKQFKTNISFRQLMEGCRSFDLLAEHLDNTLPPEPAAAAPAAPAAPVAPVAQTAVVPAPAVHAQATVQAMPLATLAMPMPLAAGAAAPLHQLIAQQMQLMQQQLALMAGVGAVPVQPVAQAAPALAMPEPTPATPAAAAATTQPATDEPVKGGVSYDVKKAFGAIARIHTAPNREITGRQQARLDAFVRRYVERTRKSKEFTAANRSHMADPRVVNGFRPATKEIVYQIVVDRSKGSRVWDIDGNEYVDTLNGFGMNMFGWQPDFINDAVRRQLDLGYEIGPQHPLAADVTRRICELTGFDRAALCNTGSEAVMAAIRIARTSTGRSTIVLFSGSYHGTFDEVLVRAGRGARGIPATPGVMSGMFGDVRVLDYGTPESLEFIREHADDLAAVLVEPVQSRRPDFQPKDFLHEVRAITEKSGTCLIFDEVITGFRSHPGGAQALFGIRADLATYGKVIGGGMPIGAIAGKRVFMDALDGGAWNYGDESIPVVGVTYFAGTFVRHPLALAAAKASLDHLAGSGQALQAKLNTHTAAMADELTAFCREVGAPIEVRYFASLWRVSWLEDHPLQDLLFAMMRSRGVHILDNFPCFMTTAHTQQDIAVIKSAFKESVAELQEAEFIPRRAAATPVFDAAHPPVPHARLGRDKDGQPAWFVPDPAAPGKFMKVEG
ncbi:amino acid adenylation domain-containing protein [Xenophilus aerolatus]|nr:amino acid adenylation domain-containing protein [Xenophilus aerolatus]